MGVVCVEANVIVSSPYVDALVQYVPATELHAPDAENGRLETNISGSLLAVPGETEMARLGHPDSWVLLRENTKKSIWPEARDETRADAW